MVGRHHEMRQETLGRRFGLSIARRHLRNDAIGSPLGEKVELSVARCSGAPIGEVYDLAATLAFNCCMRLLDEAAESFRMPMIAPRFAALAIHALLHHCPFTFIRNKEAMQVKIKAVLHCCA